MNGQPNEKMIASGLDHVPRTEAEEAQLLNGRQDGWEYLYFAAVLLRRRNELESKWEEHLGRLRRPATVTLGEQEAIDRMQRIWDQALAITNREMAHLRADEQERAFGKPGEPGNPKRIAALAESIVAGYDELLEWSADLRADGVPPRFRGIYDRASELADRPLQEFREYIDEVISSLDGLPAALREGRPTNLRLVLTLTIDEAANKRFQAELDRSAQEIQRAGAAGIGLQPGPTKTGGHFGFLRRHQEHEAAEAYAAQLAHWQSSRDACAEQLEIARTFGGDQSSELLLKRGESVYATVTGASIVEERRTAGHWEGRSSGFSFPIASIGGRSIRYRTGASRGTYVQGTPVPTAVDTGTLFVTDKRVVFMGARQTRECLFDKLVGYQHTNDGSTVFSVSNRQRATIINYGSDLTGWFDFRLGLALAHYRGEVPAFLAELEADLGAIDAARPIPPPNG